MCISGISSPVSARKRNLLVHNRFAHTILAECAEFASRTICFLFTSDLTRRSPRRQLCSQFGIMSHVFGSRSTICQYKGVTRGVSAYQFGGGAACYPKYTKSFGDTRSAFAFLPSPCHPPILPDRPSFSATPFHPFPAPVRPGYNARQIDDSIEY